MRFGFRRQVLSVLRSWPHQGSVSGCGYVSDCLTKVCQRWLLECSVNFSEGVV